MAASSGTRRGNGAGRGGPASGIPASGMGAPPRAFSAGHQPAPEAKSAGHAVAAEIRERIAAHKEAILAAQLQRATDPAHPQGHQAASDLLNRIMPPESRATVTGEGGGPLLVLTGVPRAED